MTQFHAGKHTEQLSGCPLGNAAVGQSGGPTAVINQSLVGLVKGLRGHDEIQGIFGMRFGVRGLVNDDLLRLDRIDDGRLSNIAATPSAALGSTRDKPDHNYCRRIFDACKRHNIRYFFYIGGNDSSDTLRIVSEMAISRNYELRCVHIPKTIDNDLPQSDHTPGYPSAARFVAQAFIGDDLDNRALPGIKINIVMGRHAGWLTAASVLARRYPGAGPHLIYLPEIPFDLNQFTQDVQAVYEEHGRCLVAVSEGIANDHKVPILKAAHHHLEKDAHGNIQLSGTGALGDFLVETLRQVIDKDARIRADTFGYLQRSFCGVASEIDAAEARSCGFRAAQIALSSGKSVSSIAIKRISTHPYECEIVPIAIEDVAAQTRVMGPEFLQGTNDVSLTFIDYLKPLVGKLPVTGRLYDDDHHNTAAAAVQ